eukprot:scaffold168662_cov27-Tisochrysis_lutea.AAC.2
MSHGPVAPRQINCLWWRLRKSRLDPSNLLLLAHVDVGCDPPTTVACMSAEPAEPAGIRRLVCCLWRAPAMQLVRPAPLRRARLLALALMERGLAHGRSVSLLLWARVVIRSELACLCPSLLSLNLIECGLSLGIKLSLLLLVPL